MSELVMDRRDGRVDGAIAPLHFFGNAARIKDLIVWMRHTQLPNNSLPWPTDVIDGITYVIPPAGKVVRNVRVRLVREISRAGPFGGI